MRRHLLVLAAVTLVLAGCGPTITEGTVTDKNYYVASTKPLAPSRYEVCFTKDNQTRCEFVPKSVYDKAKVGEHFVLP